MTADDEGDGAWADLKEGGGVSRECRVQRLRHRNGMFAHSQAAGQAVGPHFRSYSAQLPRGSCCTTLMRVNRLHGRVPITLATLSLQQEEEIEQEEGGGGLSHSKSCENLPKSTFLWIAD